MDQSIMKKLLLAATIFLAPSLAWGQCNGVFGANQVCGSAAGGPPGPVSLPTVGQRTRLTAGTTYYLDSTKSDSNNCLSPSTACKTFSFLYNFLRQNIDQSGQTVTIQFASGQTWNNISLSSSLVGLGAIILDGGGSTFTTSTGAPAIQINTSRSNGTVFVQNAVITCSGGGAGINVVGGITVTQTGITYGACPGGQHRLVANGGEMTASGNYTISGGAAAHIYSDAQSLEDDFQPITITITGTPAFSQAFAVAVLNGTVYSGGVTFTGAATGNRYTAQTNGFVSSVGGGAHYFPGNAEGFVTTGGHYDTPGTPVAAFVGGTAAPTVTGTDTSGNVTEGTNSTGGTITFTTANQPNACSVNTSSATVQAGLVYTLSPTVLTITHPNASGAVISWTCPPN